MRIYWPMRVMTGNQQAIKVFVWVNGAVQTATEGSLINSTFNIVYIWRYSINTYINRGVWVWIVWINALRLKWCSPGLGPWPTTACYLYFKIDFPRPSILLLISVCHSFIHSFIFSKSFFLAKVAMDLWYTLNGMPVPHKASCTHTFTHSFITRGNLTLSVRLLACFSDVRGRTWRTQRKPMQPRGKHPNLTRQYNLSSASGTLELNTKGFVL